MSRAADIAELPRAGANAAFLADDIARVLLTTGAVSVAAEERYRFGSGLRSPMYVDNRRLLSLVEARRRVTAALSAAVKSHVHRTSVNVIVGVPTGGLPWAAWLAEDLSLPLAYVRNAPKDRGLGKQIEGVLPEAAVALVVDDLVTTGQSSLVAIDALEGVGASVNAVVSIFSYGVPYAAELFAGLGITHLTVTDLDAVLRVGIDALGAAERQVLVDWRDRQLLAFRPG